MSGRPPRSTRTDRLFRYTTRFRAVIGQAYVPLAGSGNRGAVKVDVDVTGEAVRYRRLGNAAFTALIALLLPPGGLAAWLIGRNMAAQRRAGRLQRQRGQSGRASCRASVCPYV